VCRFIASHLEERLTLARLAKVAGMSAFHLQRRFTAAVGISPRAYADALRLGTFKRGLRAGRAVLDAAVEAGYGSTSRVYERTSAHLGMTPRGYRSGGAAQRIRFAIADTAIGLVLVASTDVGVCAVRMGATRRELESALRGEFPRAALTEDAEGLAGPLTTVGALAEGRAAPAMPLDIAATAFQHQVWTALQRIPRGETRSYADIARAIRRPSAVRAVANACAGNPVALLVPCHRVVRSDGTQGGYRWGTDRKAALLAAEHDPASPR
jgi:AraC family transcriptional regulator of adaptative response/methylated-DNA-[protein]-cysteine methyltransferase